MSNTQAARGRWVAAVYALVLAVVWIALLSVFLDKDTRIAVLLVDNRSGGFPYPFTIQNVMWVVFFLAIAELMLRYIHASNEKKQLVLSLLPEGHSEMLTAEMLPPLYRRIRDSSHIDMFFLQRLLVRAIKQFQISRSVDQTYTMVNTSVELFQHEIDLRFNMLRYLSWLIPTIGFIGTVVGIAEALAGIGRGFPEDLSVSADVVAWMGGLTGQLGVAFDTTLLALMLSAVIMLLMHITQEREEATLNQAANYCVDNLINRLVES